MSDAPDFDYRDPKQPQNDGAIPRFYIEATPNNARSEEDGVPRFDDTEMVEILIPGDRKSVAVQVVRNEHKQRWPRAYAAFKAGQGDAADGTPIHQLPGITRSQAEELAYQHVKTIETMAGLPDDKALSITHGGIALRDKAKRWLDTASGNAAEEKLAAENRAKDDKISELEGKLADLTARIDAMSKDGAKGRAKEPVSET